MIFHHENVDYDSATATPNRPTPLWCKVTFVATVVAVVLVITHAWWGQ